MYFVVTIYTKLVILITQLYSTSLNKIGIYHKREGRPYILEE